MNDNRNIRLAGSRRVFLLYILLGAANAFGQSYVNQTFQPAGSSASYARSMVCYDDTCIIHGFKRDLTTQIPYNVLLKVAADGSFFEENHYTITGRDVWPQYKTIVKKDDFLYLALSSRTGPDTSFSHLYKCTLTGDTVWTRQYEASTGQLIVYSLNGHPDGGFVLTGIVREVSVNEADIFILRTDSMGNELWRKTYGFPNRKEEPVVLSIRDNEEYIVGGYIGHYPPNFPTDDQYFNGLLVKFKNDGSVITKVMGRAFNSEWVPGDFLELTSNNLIVSSYVSDDLPNSNLATGLIYTIDENLNIIFQDTSSIPYRKYGGYGMVKEFGTGLVLLGSYHDATGMRRVTFTKTDVDGKVLWERQCVHTGQSGSINGAYDFKVLDDQSGFVFTGEVQDSQGQRIWFGRTDQYGCLVPDCHLADVPEHPDAPLSISLYPNPATEFLYVYNPVTEDVTGTLVDMSGRNIRESLRIPAHTTAIVPVYDLPQGIYILRIPLPQGGTFTEKIIKQ